MIVSEKKFKSEIVLQKLCCEVNISCLVDVSCSEGRRRARTKLRGTCFRSFLSSERCPDPCCGICFQPGVDRPHVPKAFDYQRRMAGKEDDL